MKIVAIFDMQGSNEQILPSVYSFVIALNLQPLPLNYCNHSNYLRDS